ncbi:MAG: tetratricopeptide repeat protein [Geminicoccaceae bacterium]
MAGFRRTPLLAATALSLLVAAGAVRADSLGEVHTGNAAFGEGQYEAAIDAFTRAILAGDLGPDALAITFNNRGVAYSELGDYDHAIQDYGQALALTPGDKTATKNLRIAHIRRATAEARLGEQDLALADYGKAIELDPNHPLAYMRRGQLQLDRGDAAAAVSDLAHAQQLDPGNGDIASLLAVAQRAAAAPTPEPAPSAAPNDYSIDRPPAAAPPAISAPEPEIQPAAGPDTEIGDLRRFRVLADVNLRQGPSNDAPVIGTLARGAEVDVDAENLGWLRIRLPDRRFGYVYKRWMELVPGQP